MTLGLTLFSLWGKGLHLEDNFEGNAAFLHPLDGLGNRRQFCERAGRGGQQSCAINALRPVCNRIVVTRGNRAASPQVVSAHCAIAR